MSRFHIEPDEVRGAGESLADTAEALRESGRALGETAERLAASADPSFTGVAAAAAMAREWAEVHVPGHAEVIGAVAEGVGAHTDDIAEADLAAAEELYEHQR